MSNQTTDDRPGPGWQNVCRACFGALIDWPGMRRCNCVTTMATEHQTTVRRAVRITGT